MPSHLRFPIAVTGSGRLATVEQDTDADIVQSVALLLDTRPGERRSIPEYGLPDPVFGGVVPAHIAQLIAAWEERADQTLVDQVATQVGTQAFEVHTGTSGPGDYEIDNTTDQLTGTDTTAAEDVSEEE